MKQVYNDWILSFQYWPRSNRRVSSERQGNGTCSCGNIFAAQKWFWAWGSQILVLCISLLELSNRFKSKPVDRNFGVSQENFACIAQLIFYGQLPLLIKTRHEAGGHCDWCACRRDSAGLKAVGCWWGCSELWSWRMLDFGCPVGGPCGAATLTDLK